MCSSDIELRSKRLQHRVDDGVGVQGFGDLGCRVKT